jgi:nucleoside-diphosphate-sugar epimerase
LRPEKSEVQRLLSNPEKARSLTGWKPQYTLDEGLQETIDWIKNNMQYFKVNIYNV